MSMSAASPIRVAIAGQGRSGYNIHAACLRKMPEQFRIVAVADQLPERRRDAEEQFGARTYDDWQTMVEAGEFDLFVNALPSPLHLPGALAALDAGYDVVCEKPTTRTVADFDRITAKAKETGRMFAPFQNNRLQPFFDKIQEVIASGVLGKIVYIRSTWGGFRRRWDWQTRQEYMGGSLFNTGPHAIDQALCLFGWEHTPEVFCRMDCRNPFAGDAEDHCTVTLYDPNRIAPQIDVIITAYMGFPQGDMYNICGTYGCLTGGFKQLRWRWFDPEKAPDHEMWHWSVDRKYPDEELDWQEADWELERDQAKNIVGYTLQSLPSGPAKFYGNIYEVLRNSAELLIQPWQIRKQVAVMEESHRQNPLPRKAE